MKGININCKKQAFTDEILNGSKTVETRNSHSLRPYVGKRVGIVRTGKGRAMLVGFCTIAAEIFYADHDAFQLDYDRHLVADGSFYDCQKSKYGYILTDVVACDPVPIFSKGIVAREI